MKGNLEQSKRKVGKRIKVTEVAMLAQTTLKELSQVFCNTESKNKTNLRSLELERWFSD